MSKRLTAEEIKLRLISKGYQEDEIKTLFKRDEDLVDFYYGTFLKMETVGNELKEEEGEELIKDDYVLNDQEKRDLKRLEDAKTAIIKEAAEIKSEEAFSEAGKHLGKGAGTPKDFKRLMDQLDEEFDD